jgi:hypothetical protein
MNVDHNDNNTGAPAVLRLFDLSRFTGKEEAAAMLTFSGGRHPDRSRSSGGAKDLCTRIAGSLHAGRSLAPLVKARGFGMTPLW